jgi:chromosome segregation ATPase
MKQAQKTILALITLASVAASAEPYSAQQGLDKIKINVETAKANKSDYEKNLGVINNNVNEVNKAKGQAQKQKDSVNTEIINNNESLKKVILQEKEIQALIAAEEQKRTEEEKQLAEAEALTDKLAENIKKRDQVIVDYKKQMTTVADEKKTWKAREVELRAQEGKTIDAIRSLASQEVAWTTKKKTYEGEAKKWSSELDKQEKISETYQGLKENK